LSDDTRLLPRALLFLLAVCAAAIISAWAVLLTRSLATGMGQDFGPNYGGAWALWHGLNPYVPAPAFYAAHLHILDYGTVESPLVLLLTSPFVLFPPRVALDLYLAVQYGLVACSSAFLAALVQRSHRVVLVALVVASPATFLVAYYGQSDAAVFLAAAVGVWARCNRRWVILGVCVAATIVKPQLGLCAAVPLLWGAPRCTWHACVASAVALFGLMGAAIGIDGMRAYVQTLRAFSASAGYSANPDGLDITSLYKAWLYHPVTQWLTASLITGILCCIFALLVRWRGAPSDGAITALGLLVTLVLPYSHQYDSIVMVPMLILAARSLRSAVPRLIMAAGVVIAALSPLMAISTNPVEFRLYPVGILLCLLALLRSMRSATPADLAGTQAPVSA
jgi:hypothetical protein